MKITNGGWKKRGAAKINFDEQIDGGRGGGMKDGMVEEETHSSDCAMAESKEACGVAGEKLS